MARQDLGAPNVCDSTPLNEDESGVVLRQNMAIYMSGESPMIARRMDASNDDLTEKKSKSVFSRSKAMAARTQVIKTYLKRQASETCNDYYGERVRFNVSGLIYETRLKTLRKYPTTLLGNEETREAYYDSNTGEYFLDRDRQTFDSILRFYQTGGMLVKPSSVPEEIFYREVNFYKLDQFLKRPESEYAAEREYLESKMPKGRKMRKVWRLMEEPASSIWAKIVSVFSVAVIFLSIWSFCIETLPSSKKLLDDVCIPINMTDESFPESISSPNSSFQAFLDFLNSTVAPISTQVSTSSTEATSKSPCKVDLWRYPFFIIETFCVICFTLELTVRFIVTPSKTAFMKSPLNLIDLAAILPYFIQIAVDVNTGYTKTDGSEDSLGSLVVLRVLRLVRILRVFKLSRYSVKLRVLGRTMISSIGELSILVFFIFLAMILFSTVVYFVESSSGPGNKFDSIPAAFWWAVVTMTTVGYGDVVPRTVLGKIVGFLCAITGVLCIALPVPSIVNNFVKQLEEAENPTRKSRKIRKKLAKKSLLAKVKNITKKDRESKNHINLTVDEQK